eukprot:TRINITY_DN1254_c0_g1_i2.p1 TRINITY_DN1254_c0_g1~~TRINITY_DN1254_c0_g1_i2.p1  ORF type:complete len:113 (-),score=20.71 TRINITY_DN1254_c0_g1_i2:120-458(-)
MRRLEQDEPVTALYDEQEQVQEHITRSVENNSWPEPHAIPNCVALRASESFAAGDGVAMPDVFALTQRYMFRGFEGCDCGADITGVAVTSLGAKRSYDEVESLYRNICSWLV